MIAWSAAKQWALSLPQVEEKDHFGNPFFRVNSKIFAQLSAEGNAQRQAVLKLSVADQAALIAFDAHTFSAIPQWGRYGWTYVQLDLIDPALFKDVLVKAWRALAPRKLVADFDEAKR